MKMLEQIIQTIIANISDYSTMLNSTNAISSVVFGGGSATLTLADTVDSRLTIGKNFIITGALFKNEIASLTPVSDGYIIETLVNHDLTENFQETVDITGFGGSWDDTFDIVSVDSPTTFTISTALGAPAGDGYILEDRVGTIRGQQAITAFTSSTIAFATTTPFELYDLTNAVIYYRYTITSAFNIDSAVKHYNERTSQKEPWAYIIYENSFVSKNNTIDSDATSKNTQNVARSDELNLNFSILIIKDNSDNNIVLKVQDELLDFRYALNKSIAGYIIDFSDYTNDKRYDISFVGDAPAGYAGAYYMHIFDYQTQLIISVDETIDNKDTAAIRSIDIGLLLEFDDYTDIKKEIEIELPT